MNRDLLVLVACQSLMMSVGAITVLTIPIIGSRLADAGALSTMPLSIQLLATLAWTFPAATLMERKGRRAGFWVGCAIGLLGALACVFALLEQNYLAYCAGIAGIGSFIGFGQFYRFAALDCTESRFHGSAVALVVAGGLVAAFLGPGIARHTAGAFDTEFLGTYLAVAVLLALSALVLARAKRISRPVVATARAPAASLARIGRQPVFLLAVSSATVGNAVMVAVMIATPVSMQNESISFDQVSVVVQMHFVGMFAPSFITGALTNRFGVPKLLLAGCVLQIVALCVGLGGETPAHYAALLFLVGVGWNFLYVGGTTLLADLHADLGVSKAQAFNDFLLVGCAAVASTLAGSVYAVNGWDGLLSGLLLAMLLLTLIVNLLSRYRSRMAGNGVPIA